LTELYLQGKHKRLRSRETQEKTREDYDFERGRYECTF